MSERPTTPGEAVLSLVVLASLLVALLGSGGHALAGAIVFGVLVWDNAQPSKPKR